MVISGILILTKEGMENEARKGIKGFPGVEVHHTEGQKIIITLEAEDLDKSHDISEEMEKVSGVLGVYLVTTNYEDAESLEVEV